MTDPKTPSKAERVKEALKGAGNAVNFLRADKRQAIGETLKGASSKAHSWNEERREAKKEKKDITQREKNEQDAKKARIEEMLKRGRYRMRDPKAKRRGDKILGHTTDEGDDGNQDKINERASENSDLKGLDLFIDLDGKSADIQSHLHENRVLFACVMELLYDYHNNKKVGEQNTLVERLNINPDNIHNILSVILGSLRDTVISKPEMIRIMTEEDELSPGKILFTKGFCLDENADQKALKPKIDKFNEIMDKLSELKRFGNVYQTEYGEKEAADAIREACEKIEGGMNAEEAIASTDQMPTRFDLSNPKTFDEKKVEKILEYLGGVEKARPKPEEIKEIIDSGELNEELEFLKILANAFAISDEDYNLKHKNVYFDGKERVDVLNQINDEMGDLGSRLHNIGRNDKANRLNILNDITEGSFIESKDLLIDKVKEIYKKLQGIYPKLKESNHLYVKRVREESREELADDIFDKL